MGWAGDDPAALGVERASSSWFRWRKFLPAVAAARVGASGIDINVTARESAHLCGRCASRTARGRDGSDLDGDCPEIWRGEVEDPGSRAGASSMPVDLPSGYHELEAKVAGRRRRRCLLIISPPRCYEPASTSRAGPVGHRRTALPRCVTGELGHRGFQRSRALIRWVASHGGPDSSD